MNAAAVIVLLGSALGAGVFTATAQDGPPSIPDPVSPLIRPIEDDSDAPDTNAFLGEPFESIGLGIAMRGPAGSRIIRQVGGTQVDFVHEKNKWNMKVARLTLDQPMPLESSRDDQGGRKVGLLEVTLDRLKDQLPGSTILRNDVIRLGQIDVGMIALRYTKGLETLLSQQALIHANDTLYFTLTLTSPGSKARENPADDSGSDGDPAEKRAAEVFSEVLDTVRLLDQRPLIRDQEERLYATRALLVNLSGKGRLENLLKPRQWFRLQRNGKDIGYVYTEEEMGDAIPGDARGALRPRKPAGRAGPAGILIGTRSRVMAGEDRRLDAESWMFCALDRRSEEWSTLQVIENLKTGEQIDHATTVGSSSRHLGRRLDRKANALGIRGEKEDPNQPPVRETDDYILNVTHTSKTENGEPLSQGVSDWYVPQALSHLLPRLLPLEEPKKYMFAAYVPDVRLVMLRYVDVGAEARVNFNGESVRAVPISDRIGYEGSVTTHYMTLGGQYIGSENPDSGIVIVPSDEKTLLDIWKDADLTRPADVKRAEKPSASGALPSAKTKPSAP